MRAEKHVSDLASLLVYGDCPVDQLARTLVAEKDVRPDRVVDATLATIDVLRLVHPSKFPLHVLNDALRGLKEVLDLKNLQEDISVCVTLAVTKPEEIDEAVSAADAEIEALKSQYKDLTGARPRGNPSVETLRSMVAEVQAA